MALALTGAIGARIGGSPVLRATIRVVIGGALALAAARAMPLTPRSLPGSNAGGKHISARSVDSGT